MQTVKKEMKGGEEALTHVAGSVVRGNDQLVFSDAKKERENTFTGESNLWHVTSHTKAEESAGVNAASRHPSQEIFFGMQ